MKKSNVKRSSDYVGLKFGRLTVIKRVELKKRQVKVLARCSCKNKTVKKFFLSNLKKGNHTFSCGCYNISRLKINKTTHGKSGFRIYCQWSAMLQRCQNKKVPQFKHWGGRGITVCDRWLKFENFYEDMGKCPKNFTIDRIDNDKGYYKKNCRWVSKRQQQRNKRNSRYITYQKRTMTLVEWSEKTKISIGVLHYRLRKKWPIKEVFNKKKFKNGNHRRGHLKQNKLLNPK